MRLICPNCGAQYEVPDDVIPDAGRDVQCSSCGNTWYQHHPDNDPDLREELIASGFEDETLAEEMAYTEAAEEETAPTQDIQPQRRSLDPSIAEVLREEAEREARARAAEAAPLESQPDLGLQDPEDEADRRARQVRERMARMKGQTPEENQSASPDSIAVAPAPIDPAPIAPGVHPDDSTVSRRDLLPDIDEINSSLRAASDRRPSEADDHDLPGSDVMRTRNSGGFRRGFSLALMLAAILWAVYSTAPRISAAVPALQPALTRYVYTIDQGRDALDTQVLKLLTQINATQS